VSDLPLTGGCLCGGVRFEITEPFESSGYCHCTRCQRRTGTAASANARAKRGAVRVLSGEQLIKVFAPPDGWPKVFCSECGSALWSQDPDDAELKSVRLGSLDGDPGIRPQQHTYVAYAAVWEPLPDDGLPRYPEARTA